MAYEHAPRRRALTAARRAQKTQSAENAAWVPLFGEWSFSPPGVAASASAGTAISNLTMREGTIRTDITLPDARTMARIMFGFADASQSSYAAGIGGEMSAYGIEQLGVQYSRPLQFIGPSENLQPDKPYGVEVTVRGQSATLFVDGVRVIAAELPEPLIGQQIGAYAIGRPGVEFRGISVHPIQPRAFVAMQFGEPFDAIYTEVIQPVCAEMDMDVFRADEVYESSVILKDIIAGLLDSTVVVAEISPENPNVFYELGYAHARGKPTILLAQRGRKLPFDVSGYRTIFYDDSIGGKRTVEDLLRKHLQNNPGRQGRGRSRNRPNRQMKPRRPYSSISPALVGVKPHASK
jgi:hypothetical protein